MKTVWGQHWPRVEGMYSNSNTAVVIFTHIAIAEPAYRAVNIYEHGGYRDESGKLVHMLIGHTEESNDNVGSVDPTDPCYGFERQDLSCDEVSIQSGLRRHILEGRKEAVDVFGTRREIEGVSVGLDTAADAPKPTWHTIAILISAGLRKCEGFRVMVHPKATDASEVFLERFTFTTPTWNSTMFLPRDVAWSARYSKYQRGVHSALATTSAGVARASIGPSTQQQRDSTGGDSVPMEDRRGESRHDPVAFLLALLPLLVAVFPWLERRLSLSQVTVMVCSIFGILRWLAPANVSELECSSTSAGVDGKGTSSPAKTPSHGANVKKAREPVKKGSGGFAGLLGGCCWCRS